MGALLLLIRGPSAALCYRFRCDQSGQVADIEQSLAPIRAIDEVLHAGALEPAGEGVGLESGYLADGAESHQVT